MKIKRFYDKNIHKEVNPNDITFIDVENGEVKKVGYDVKMGIVTHHIDTNNFDLEFEQEKVMTDRHVDFKYTCGKCGNEVDVEDIYCKTCGTKILWENEDE